MESLTPTKTTASAPSEKVLSPTALSSPREGREREIVEQCQVRYTLLRCIITNAIQDPIFDLFLPLLTHSFPFNHSIIRAWHTPHTDALIEIGGSVTTNRSTSSNSYGASWLLVSCQR
jgi:hypothetical protein